ncbi:MAG: Crp/Fnr family transcriptional regulator, partial [Candidatus Eremiobacteraeota bacterium]|nr:Crp/Fnr family transcriptional regulator [Candidatus Eremiobacteraeota bacterium]
MAKVFDPQEFLAVVGDGRTIRSYHKDETVFSQGDPANSVFYIQSGRVKLTVLSTLGKEAVVAVLDTGCFFGEGCLAAQPVRMATATTMTETSIIEVQKADMIRVLHDEKQFSGLFIAHLLSRNIRIEEDLVD